MGAGHSAGWLVAARAILSGENPRALIGQSNFISFSALLMHLDNHRPMHTRPFSILTAMISPVTFQNTLRYSAMSCLYTSRGCFSNIPLSPPSPIDNLYTSRGYFPNISMSPSSPVLVDNPGYGIIYFSTFWKANFRSAITFRNARTGYG